MSNITYDLKVNAQQAIDQLKKVSDNIQRVGNDFKTTFDGAESLAKKLQAALLVAGAATAKFADEISDIATANNVATNEVLGLAKALSISGGNADNAGRVFQQLSNSILEANGGNEKTIKTFERLGVSISDLGSLSDTEIRNKLLKGLSEIPVASERNALAFQLFGKSLQGVDLENFVKNTDELTKKYEKNSAAVETAAAAWDNLSGIITDLKVAFAEAFAPVFSALSKLKISVEDLVIVWKVLAVAMTAAFGASMAGLVIKMIGLMSEFNKVTGRNKLIFIVGTLLSVATGLAAITGLTNDADDAQKQLNDSTKEGNKNTKDTVRDQSDLLDKRKKEIDAIRKVNEVLSESFKKQREKLDLELESIGLSEQQKKVNQEVLNIQQQANEKILALKQQYDAQSSDAQGRTKKAYDEERAAIQDNADIQKKAIEGRLLGISRVNEGYRRFAELVGILNTSETKLFALEVERLKGLSNYKEQISITERQVALDDIRNRVLTEIGKTESLNKDQQEQFNRLITEVTTDVRALSGEFGTVAESLGKLIEKQVEAKAITAEQANEFKRLSSNIVLGTSVATEGIVKQREAIAESQRTFGSGWTRAFNDYVDNATNAASIAENLFRRATQGMEDAIVSFAKTGKFEFKNFVAMMAEELLRSQVRQLMANIMLGTKAMTGGGGLMGGIGKLFGFAGGGVIGGNQPILVGERGPEVFMPPGAGNIIPNGALGGATQVTYNINAVDASSFQALVARNPQFIHAVAEQGRRSMPGARI